MAISEGVVAGERVGPLLRALAGIEIEQQADGMCTWEGRFAPDVAAPLFRAIMRVEAELLLDDADDLRPDSVTVRTPDQRRADAFVALALRVADAATA